MLCLPVPKRGCDVETGGDGAGPELLLADDYRIEPHGHGFLGAVVVEDGGELDRRFNPFNRSTLPEELARLTTEGDVLAFAQRNGLLAYDEAEPVEFMLNEARKARLVMALANALQVESAPLKLPWGATGSLRYAHAAGLIEARVKELIGADCYEALRAAAGQGVGKSGVRPVWREYPAWRGKPQGGLTGDAALILEPLTWAYGPGIARLVICDTLNAPVMGVPYLKDRKIRNGVATYLAPGPLLLPRGVSETRFLVHYGVGNIRVVGMAEHVLAAIRWWFQQEISSGREVRECAWCHNYFFVYDGRQRYCRRPAGDPGPADESPCAIAARGKRFRGRRHAVPLSLGGSDAELTED